MIHARASWTIYSAARQLKRFVGMMGFWLHRKWHPDRNKDNKEKAEKKFREVGTRSLSVSCA